MRGLFAAVCVLVLMGCQRGAGGPGNVLPGGDAGDAGPDGSICVGSRYPCSDGGTPDAGPDAGPTETPDAGPAHTIGGLGWGPFPHAPMTIYGSADGLLEAPVSASVDEGENLWVATEKALYLLQPGAKVFRRYTAQDGLHVGAGYTEPPDFTMVEGGGAGEAFVGYYAHDTNTSMFPDAHWYTDPIAHMGKMDQVLLHADGTLTVNRYDLRNTNDGRYYETRTVMSMVYDHFQHPGNLYVGSNHGITRIVPAKYFPPRRDPADPGWNNDEKVWYADHVHPWVCLGGPCDDKHPSVFGDWFGLTLAPDGRLWMGGLTCAGALNFREALGDWIQSWEPVNPFDPALLGPPVFQPPSIGASVNIRGVAATPDGTIWFASGEAESWRGATYGIAAWYGDPAKHSAGHFSYYDPMQLGAIEYNILEVQALPDGRLVFGFPTTGLLSWKPGDAKGRRITQRDGLPGEQIRRMSLDRMHDPPMLLVPTDAGLAAFRDVP